ncbi:MAG: hypothetical protein ACLFU4_07085 [Opitutales bacterium]
MMNLLRLTCLATILLSGCATNNPNAEFVRTVTFSSMQTFDFKHSLLSGMDFRESEKMLLEGLSEGTLVQAFQARGFERTGENPDFHVVAKWEKSVSTAVDLFDPIDGPLETLHRRESRSAPFASRLHLTVEVYDAKSDVLFWRKDLSNLFEAVQLTEARVVDSLERAVKNFPERVEKDPSLPDIE